MVSSVINNTAEMRITYEEKDTAYSETVYKCADHLDALKAEKCCGRARWNKSSFWINFDIHKPVTKIMPRHLHVKPPYIVYRDWETDRKSTRLNSSHRSLSRMPSSA